MLSQILTARQTSLTTSCINRQNQHWVHCLKVAGLLLAHTNAQRSLTPFCLRLQHVQARNSIVDTAINCRYAAAGAQDDTDTFNAILHQASAVRGQNAHWVHCLKVAGLLLQQLPSARLRTIGAGQFGCVEDLWPLLIMPGLGHAVAAVRYTLCTGITLGQGVSHALC